MDESKINTSQNLSLQGDGQRKFIERKQLNQANFSVTFFFLWTTRTQSLFSVFTHTLEKLIIEDQRKEVGVQQLFLLCIVEDVLSPLSLHNLEGFCSLSTALEITATAILHNDLDRLLDWQAWSRLDLHRLQSLHSNHLGANVQSAYEY